MVRTIRAALTNLAAEVKYAKPTPQDLAIVALRITQAIAWIDTACALDARMKTCLCTEGVMARPGWTVRERREIEAEFKRPRRSIEFER